MGAQMEKYGRQAAFSNLQGKTLKELRALPKDDKGLLIIQ
jgi:hypothetical protein